ncbi:MAG: AI-2E family transporter [Sarcina sp.]
MKLFKGNNSKYTKLVLSLVVTYIIIRLIDNIPFITDKLSDFYGILLPFVIAFVIAYALNPVVNLFMRRTKLSKSMSIALTYILFLAIIAMAALYIFPGLYSTTWDLIESLPTITTNAQHTLNTFLSQVNKHPDATKLLESIDFSSIISTSSKVFNSLLNQAFSGAISITTYIVNIIFGFLISIYMLSDKENCLKFCRKATLTVCGEKIGDEVINFVKILNFNVGTYIGIKAIDSAIVAAIAIVGLTILGAKYALLLAVIVGFTNMIPYFGPFIGMFVAFVVNLFSADFKTALIALIFLFILQQFDAWFLDPKLIGGKVGLSPFVIILAVTIGGAFYGPIGMILATPIASVINYYVQKGLKKFSHRRKSKIKKIENKDK